MTDIFIPVKVNKRTYKHLLRDCPGKIFHRIDKAGQHWVKAADHKGRIEIERYQLKATL